MPNALSGGAFRNFYAGKDDAAAQQQQNALAGMRQQQFGMQQKQFQDSQQDRQKRMMQEDILPAVAAITMSAPEQRPVLWQQIVPELKGKYRELANIPDQYDEAAFVRFLPQAFGPEMSAKIIAERFAPAQQQTGVPGSIQEYELARSQGFGGSFADWMRLQKTQVQQFRADNPAPQKPPKDMRVKPGTVDEFEVIPGSATDMKRRAAKSADDKNLKLATSTLDGAIRTIDQLIGAEADDPATPKNEAAPHPGLSSIVGSVDAFTPTVMPDSRDALTLHNKLKGQASIEGLRTIRGTSGAIGAITEKEWPRLEQLRAAVENAQSEKQYREELTNYRAELRQIKKLMEQAYQETYAAGDYAPPQQQQQPIKFLGFE